MSDARRKPKAPHVTVESDDGWLIAQGLEEPGVITQGKTMDELLANIRAAAELLLNVRDLQIELIVPATVRVAARKPARRRAG